MIGPHQQPADVGRDQADEPDGAAERDHAADHQRRRREEQHPHGADGDAAARRQVLARREQVELARVAENHGRARDHEREHVQHGVIADGFDSAHQPAHDPERAGEVAQVLDQQDEAPEEEAHRHAGQQQERRREGPAGDRDAVDHGERRERAREGGERDRRDPEDRERPAQADRHRRAERGAARDAQRERLDERVPEHRLERHPCQRQPRPRQEGHHRPGHPDLPEDEVRRDEADHRGEHDARRGREGDPDQDDRPSTHGNSTGRPVRGWLPTAKVCR